MSPKSCIFSYLEKHKKLLMVTTALFYVLIPHQRLKPTWINLANWLPAYRSPQSARSRLGFRLILLKRDKFYFVYKCSGCHSSNYFWVCYTDINHTGLIKRTSKMYMTTPNGSIPLDRVTQVLTLSGLGSKLLPNETWLLLLLGPLVTIILLLIFGLFFFFKLLVKFCLLQITTGSHQDNDDAKIPAISKNRSCQNNSRSHRGAP